MEFVGVDDELRVDAQAAQRLVHLLAALHGDVEIALAAEEHRRRLDAVGVQERIGNLHVGFPRFRIPRRTDFVVVLDDVLVGAVEGDGERRSGAAGGGFETRVGGDHVVGQDAAVAPAADAHACRDRRRPF